MDTIEKLFVAWVIICVLIFLMSIITMVIAFQNRRKIKDVESNLA